MWVRVDFEGCGSQGVSSLQGAIEMIEPVISLVLLLLVAAVVALIIERRRKKREEERRRRSQAEAEEYAV